MLSSHIDERYVLVWSYTNSLHMHKRSDVTGYCSKLQIGIMNGGRRRKGGRGEEGRGGGREGREKRREGREEERMRV